MRDGGGTRPFVMLLDSDVVFFNHSMRVEEYVARSGVQPFVINGPLPAKEDRGRCPQPADFFVDKRQPWPLRIPPAPLEVAGCTRGTGERAAARGAAGAGGPTALDTHTLLMPSDINTAGMRL